MITIGELIHSVKKEAVFASLAFVYDGESESPEGYSRAWDTLLSLQPKSTTLSCLLSTAEFGVDVSGIEPNDPTHYAIEFVDWAEWLSMPVIIAPELGDMSPVEQLTHILYELTWGGYDPKNQQDQFQEIEDRVEEVKEILDKEKPN